MKEFFRYGAVSAVAFALDFALYVSLVQFVDISYLWAAAVGFCVGLVCTYILSVRLVFTQRRFDNRHAEFAVFALIGMLGLGMNQSVLFVLVNWCDIHYMLAKIMTAGAVFCFNFGTRKLMLFSRAPGVPVYE